MPNIQPKISFNQIVKQPAVYLMVVAITIAGVFIGLYQNSNNNGADNCEKDKLYYRDGWAKSEAQKEKLTLALLITHGIIKGMEQTTDSVIREKVGNKAKAIVNKNSNEK